MKNNKSRNIIQNILLFVLVVITSILYNGFVIAQNSGNRAINNEAFGIGERLEYKVGMIGGVLSGLGGSGGIAINKTPRKFTNSNNEVRDCYEINF
jgi:uncharacterized membrane protein YfcA